MKVLMLSTDTGILVKGSEVEKRMLDYGSLVGELHIIVKSQKPKVKSQRLDNVFIYPTNDRFNFLYFFNAYKIGQEVIKSSSHEITQLLITSQDPFETGLVGYLLKRKFGVRLQIQIHTDFLSPYFRQESLKNKVRVILGKWLVERADGIRVVSERIRLSLSSKLQILSSKIFVLPIFVDTEKIKNAPIRTDLHKKYPNYNFIILMASRLTREKNIGLAIGAVKYLIPNYPNVLLLIVGDGPELKTLKLQVTRYGLQDNVVFESWTDDLVSYYKTADLFLLTSNYEGYGRTIVEATTVGLPVLMTDVGLTVGCKVPIGDKNALIEGLNCLIDSKQKRVEILENQRESINLYNSKESYLNLIKQSWQNCFL